MPADTPADVAAALARVAAEPGATKPDPLLVAEGVTRAFGGLTAVHVDRLEVQRGTITALIGPNGAGKSTLFNVLSGFDRADAGTWSFDGTPVAGRGAHRIARRGLVRTFQLTRTLSKLSVLDNMKLAATGQRGEHMLLSLLPPVWIRQEKEIERRADDLLERFKLAHMRDEYAGTLSGGQRKLLEMARALMMRPTMVMLDEPMAGVNPALTQSLLSHITDLRDEGLTVCFVEHDMDVVMGISDWVVCLAEGRIVAEGPPRTVGADPAVIDAYLGRHHDEPGSDTPGPEDSETGGSGPDEHGSGGRR
ncbi:ABC transporter ATP-binding protein [Saccharomonospora saliphila]|uniref:ABC transporter ATP-binding protein n=1 Tax=Saccharomonospora saliphila TaxID=369829 RepID=UPI000378161A|nr:ABC transporter ATP-binding protein [Saccharomonospora saliphila]